jgi:GH43 family beta-xylosidase
MKFEEWETKYRPVVNPNSDDIYFDTHDEKDVEAVRNADPGKVWTECETDDVQYILPGLHSVNRMRYLITEVADEGEDEITIER